MSMAQFITLHKRFGVATARPDDEEGWDGRYVGAGRGEHTHTSGFAGRNANGNLDDSEYVNGYGNGVINGNGNGANGVNGHAH
jgi:hypothetical protein